MKSSLLTIAVVALGVMAGACTSAVGESDVEGSDGAQTSDLVTAGEFALYATPHAIPDPVCDASTSLVLRVVGDASHATLRDVSRGECAVSAPNTRSFRLTHQGSSCGSEIYVGTSGSGDKLRTIKVTDHRGRMCEDIVPAKIVVEETAPGASTAQKLYATDMLAPGGIVRVDGAMKKVQGIGGETTGFAIVDADDESYELVLDEGEKNQFSDMGKALVTGVVTYLKGAEIPNRRALDVTEILVCPASPTTVTCTPGPFVRLSNMCSVDRRAWLATNCPTVTFVD